MILLKDLFSILTTGAYANTVFSGTDNVLKEEHYTKVINLTNLGLVEIYKRFKLLENELVLHVFTSIDRYYLRSSKVASAGHTTDYQYIEEPSYENMDGFLNVVKITGAFASDGTELRVNNPSRQTSLYPQIVELSPDTLKITNILSDQTINLMYQAYPNKIVVADEVDLPNYELNIPDVIIDPLVSYIAAKTFKPMGANDSTANADKSNSYEQAYELACQKIMLYGLYGSDHTEVDKFDNEFNRNGWV